jgi:hypothetical protein
MNELIERPLTPTEIKQRQRDHLQLLTEIDNFRDEATEHRRCAKEAATEIERLEQRERVLRRELRSGTVFEARQREFSLEYTDPGPSAHARENGHAEAEPEDDTDPPEHDKPELTTYAEYETRHYQKFAQRYPAARDFTDLMVALGQALTLEQLKSLSAKAMVKLHPSSAEFQDIAHWARVSNARADTMASAQRGEPGEGGITIPLLPPMPEALMQALGMVPKRAPKRASKKVTNGAAQKTRAPA